MRTDLDPRLQRAAAEYLEHKNHQIRLGRRYAPVLFLVFVVITAAMIGMFMWWWNASSNKMDEDFERKRQEMNEEHDRRTNELHERAEELRDQAAPSPR
ncbi:MAG: hypothetical protein AB7P03_29700 [Kofleriaceae bacterium]